jgi:teichuronic acid exporter
LSLKQKTINGLFWSFIDNFSTLGFQFIIGIILARILSPREFGLIGIVTVFVVILQAFIESGFKLALIRKQNCTQKDYSTVFYFNLVLGIFLFAVLFFSAGSLSDFFDEPELKPLVKVLGLTLIIDSFGIIQRAIISKQIDFKIQTKVTVISSIVSGIIGIGMALYGFGVWSLVARTIISRVIISVLLWIWVRWQPVLIFCKTTFLELFSFSYKLILSRLMDVVFKNIYYVVVGKYFSASDLGFYTRADSFKNLSSTNLSWIIERVSYPVLSKLQDDNEKLVSSYQKIIKITMYATFIVMCALAAIAEPFIITLIGEKWLPSVVFLQLLSIEGMFYPLHALNLNMLQVKGRSDLYLRIEIIKKALAVPVIILGIFTSIKIMIIGMIVLTIICLYISTYYSGKLVGYSFKHQIVDILPSLIVALSIAGAAWGIGQVLNFNYTLILIIQIVFILFATIVVGEGLKQKEYLYIKNTVLKEIQSIYQRVKKSGF